jgi:deaminated glutathione amidase
MTQYCIAAVQMVSTLDTARNLADADHLIAKAAAAGAQLVLLPECFTLISKNAEEKLASGEQAGNGPIQAFLASAARRHRLWLVGGTIPLTAPDQRLFNAALVFDPHGQQIARYDKIHLFRFSSSRAVYDEARVFQPGKTVCAFDAPFGRVGLSICYDLRFPELYRALGDCVLMTVSAAFTCTTGRAHWTTLLRARAIENQCFVLAAAQGGQHESGCHTWGHSMLVDPWGKIVTMQATGPGVVIGTLDLSRIQAVRSTLPAHRQRILV